MPEASSSPLQWAQATNLEIVTPFKARAVQTNAMLLSSVPMQKNQTNVLKLKLETKNNGFKAIVGVAAANALAKTTHKTHKHTISNEYIIFDEHNRPVFAHLPPNTTDMTQAYDGLVTLHEARANLPPSNLDSPTPEKATDTRRGRGGSADKRTRHASKIDAPEGMMSVAGGAVAWGFNPYDGALYACADARGWGVPMVQTPTLRTAHDGSSGTHSIDITIAVDLGPSRALFVAIGDAQMHKVSKLLPESVRAWALLPCGASLEIISYESKRGTLSTVPLPKTLHFTPRVPLEIQERWAALSKASSELVETPVEANTLVLGEDVVKDAWAELAAAERTVAGGMSSVAGASELERASPLGREDLAEEYPLSKLD